MTFRRGDIDDLRAKLADLLANPAKVAKYKAEAPDYIPFAQLGHGDAADAGGLSRGCAAGRAASGFAAGSAGG